MRILTKKAQDFIIQNKKKVDKESDLSALSAPKYKLPQISSKKSYSPVQQYLSKTNVKANIYIKSKSEYQRQKQMISCVKMFIPTTDSVSLSKAISKIIQFNNQRISFLQNDDMQIVDQPIKSLSYQGQPYKQRMSLLNTIFGGCGFQIKQKDVLIAEGQKSKINYIFFTNCPHHPISICCNANILLKNSPNKTIIVCTTCRRQMIKFIPRDLKQYFLGRQKSKSSHLKNGNLQKLQQQKRINIKQQPISNKRIQRLKASTRLDKITQQLMNRPKNHHSYSRNTNLQQSQNHQKLQNGVSLYKKSNTRNIRPKDDFIDKYTHHLQNSIERQRMKINFSLLIASGRYKKFRINQSVALIQRIKHPQSTEKYYMKHVGTSKN